MYRLYLDIRDKLGEPLWHDEQGVPRYVEFHPEHCGIYDNEVALLEIRCRGCGRLFLVSDSWDHTDWYASAQAAKDTGQPMPDLRDGSMAKPNATNYGGGFSFGDAPWHTHEGTDGQCSGTTMTTDTVRVVEFWRREHCEWLRCLEYEFSYPLDEGESEDAGATPSEVGAPGSAHDSSSSLSASGRPDASAPTGWQPIETAPKDGTNFLAVSHASSVFLAHWANGVVDSSSFDNDYGYNARLATHWMPLPSPPDGRKASDDKRHDEA